MERKVIWQEKRFGRNCRRVWIGPGAFLGGGYILYEIGEASVEGGFSNLSCGLFACFLFVLTIVFFAILVLSSFIFSVMSFFSACRLTFDGENYIAQRMLFGSVEFMKEDILYIKDVKCRWCGFLELRLSQEGFTLVRLSNKAFLLFGDYLSRQEIASEEK